MERVSLVCTYSTEPEQCACLFEGLGMESVETWLNTNIVGCLQKFFMDCMKGNFLKDPKVV